MFYRILTPTRRYTRGQYEHEDTIADAEPPTCAEGPDCETTRSPLDLPLHKPSCIDNEYTDHTANPKVCGKASVLGRQLILMHRRSLTE